MSIEAVLTLITVALAVAALIPHERAQDFQVRFGTLARTTAAFAAILILYWALLEEVHSLPGIEHVSRPILWPSRFKPDSLSLVLVLSIAGMGYWSYRRALPVYRLSKLKSVLTDALARRRYGESMHLIETHLSTISRAHEGEYWQARLRARVAPTIGELFIRAHARSSTRIAPDTHNNAGGERSNDGDIERSFQVAPVRSTPQRERLLKHFTEWAERPREAAQEIIRGVSLAPALVNEIASANPYLGLAVLRIPSSWLLRDFADDFVRALMKDEHSALYRELRQSQNIDNKGWLEVDAKVQPLIAALCEDAVRRDGPVLVYTFLAAGIDSVRTGHRGPLHGTINGPLGDFAERGRWVAPPFAAIYLLRIVGPRIALTPGAQLLNLYMTRTLVIELLHQLSPTDDVDMHGEWPTPTHYLLHETVSTLRDLVRIVKDKPYLLDAVRADQGHSADAITLPDHAITVLGAVMYECMKSPKLDMGFKAYLLEVWWLVYWEKYQPKWPGSERVLEAFARGGELGGDIAHRDAVAGALSHIDTVLQLSDSAEALRRRFGI